MIQLTSIVVKYLRSMQIVCHIGSLSVVSALWTNSPHMIDSIVQTTHLAHGLGAGLAPLIVAPFQRQTGDNATGAPTSTHFASTTSQYSQSTRSSAIVTGIQPIQVYTFTGTAVLR